MRLERHAIRSTQLTVGLLLLKSAMRFSVRIPHTCSIIELEVRVCDRALRIGLGLHIGGDVWGPLQPEHHGEAFRQFADDDAANPVA
jgi:hypothetical protein